MSAMESFIYEKNSRASVDKYLNMPYKRSIYPTGDVGKTAFFAEVSDFEGCYAEGETYVDAYEALTREMEIYIALCLKEGKEPPPPKVPNKFSGKILVRMPTSLHCKLTLAAKEENVSVNQFIVSTLSAST